MLFSYQNFKNEEKLLTKQKRKSPRKNRKSRRVLSMAKKTPKAKRIKTQNKARGILSVGFKAECLDDAVVLAENIFKPDGKDISQAMQAVAKITWSRKIRNNCRHLHSRNFRQIIHKP